MTNEQMIKGLERLIKKSDDPEGVFFYGHALTKIKNIEKCKPKLCKNCEFWVSQDKEVGGCWSKQFVYEPAEEYEGEKGSRLLYSDYEGVSADVVTEKNFGCVHFGYRIKGEDE